MVGEQAFRRLVRALWVLARTSGMAADAGGSLAAAIDDCAGALRGLLVDESHFVLQERDGALFANGVRLRLDLEAFTAIEEVCALFRRRGIGEMLFTAAASRVDLQRLCAWLVSAPRQVDADADLETAGVHGVFVAVRRADGARTDPAALAAGARSSRLQSVYLHNELLAAHGSGGLLGAQHVHAALQVLVAQLLQRPDGCARIELLQGDESLGGVVRVSVMAILLGQAVGCEDPLVAELALDGFFRRVGDLHASGDAARTDARTGAAILRFARRAADLAAAPGRSAAEVVGDLADEAAGGTFPRELVAPFSGLLQPPLPGRPGRTPA